MKSNTANRVKVIVTAIMALMILLSSAPAGAFELAMLTGDSSQTGHGNLIQPSVDIQPAMSHEDIQKPAEYNKSLKDIFELPPQP